MLIHFIFLSSNFQCILFQNKISLGMVVCLEFVKQRKLMKATHQVHKY